ncbi:hypothetical protein [Alteromonas sp. CYL-A6]|uniref:hypothetical protein n=1 Tax=Alteromonas nitratireducens TaxID=3390813 RepID=UPI0034B75C2C
MLGFEYEIFLIDEDVKEHPIDQFASLRNSHLFATFKVGPYSGLWIQKLEKQGIAEYRGGNNYYPNRYTVPFNYVLPQLIKEPEKYGSNVIGDDYYVSADYIPNIVVNQNIIKRCSPESLCLVEEWDMS